LRPFRINGEALDAHRIATQALITSASIPPTVAIESENLGGKVAFGVARCAGAERTSRNRGADVFVVPLMDLGSGLLAWLGYREEWSLEAVGKSKLFSFQSSSATIHFGFEGIEPKPQMFRAEWAGLVKDGKGWGFQAGDAGHPHWQFDGLESIATTEDAEAVAELIRADRPEPALREFGVATIDMPEVKAVASSRATGSIHFASAAAWWRSHPSDAHAHHPENVQQIQRWLSRTLSYISVELRRV